MMSMIIKKLNEVKGKESVDEEMKGGEITDYF
jgi:hypothetical protein